MQSSGFTPEVLPLKEFEDDYGLKNDAAEDDDDDDDEEEDDDDDEDDDEYETGSEGATGQNRDE